MITIDQIQAFDSSLRKSNHRFPNGDRVNNFLTSCKLFVRALVVY